MSLWTMIFLLAFAGMIFAAWRHHNDSRMGVVRDDHGHVTKLDSGREAELEREIHELRERVKVLERIATDDREAKRLSSQIENLRDE